MRARSLPWLLTLLLVQCGGSSATSGEPKSPDSDGDDARSSGADSDDGAAEPSESSVADKQPQGPNCDDGTCSPCGSGICPSGWFCDENASGGPACSWLKECADKPSCGCVTRVLGAACKCREEAGGLKVSCS